MRQNQAVLSEALVDNLVMSGGWFGVVFRILPAVLHSIGVDDGKEMHVSLTLKAMSCCTVDTLPTALYCALPPLCRGPGSNGATEADNGEGWAGGGDPLGGGVVQLDVLACFAQPACLFPLSPFRHALTFTIALILQLMAVFMGVEAGVFVPICCAVLYVLLTLVNRARVRTFNVFVVRSSGPWAWVDASYGL